LKTIQSGEFEQATEHIVEKYYPIEQLLASGRIIRVPNGTSCLVIESGRSMYKVTITEGLAKNQTYWVHKTNLVNPKQLTSPGSIATGIWV